MVLARDMQSQNHRMAWVEKDHNGHLVATPPLCAGSPSTRPGCPELHIFYKSCVLIVFLIKYNDWKRVYQYILNCERSAQCAAASKRLHLRKR